MSVNASYRPREHSLALRRRKVRRRKRVAIGILLVVLCGALWYGLWRPSVRITAVTVSGTADPIVPLAKQQMKGSFWHIVPRDSFFFLSKQAIRSAILSAYPDIGALSIRRTGFTSLSLAAVPRMPVARWCGTAASSTALDTIADDVISNPSGACYVFDAGGFIYATASPFMLGTTTGAISPDAASSVGASLFPIFDGLVGSTSTPVTGTLASIDFLPSVFDFARKLSTFGVRVSAIVVRPSGEVDDFVVPFALSTSSVPTRITYVLGEEQEAYAALVAGQNDLNLSSGAVDYVDLRFSGKIYFKPKS